MPEVKCQQHIVKRISGSLANQTRIHYSTSWRQYVLKN